MMHDLLSQLKSQADADYIGEPISQLDHSLQAASLAKAAGESESLVLAALFHDIGHWCSAGEVSATQVGVVDHDRIGEQYLKQIGVAEKISSLVGLHVQAKRYKAFSETGYEQKISPASLQTLSLQGGPMKAAEAKTFESNPYFREALALRGYDEAAKKQSCKVAPVESYESMLRRHLIEPLPKRKMTFFKKNGFVRIKSWFNDHEMARIEESVRKMESWPEVPGKWMKYFEYASNQRTLCRIENFLEYEEVFSPHLLGDSFRLLLNQVMGAPVVLFKEKINFKQAGGQGFRAHQDAPAFRSFGQNFHLNLMLSIDHTSSDNGCLELMRSERIRDLLPAEKDLTLSEDFEMKNEWISVETEPGDILVFDSYIPHKSAANLTKSSRRALYATYNKACEGNWREKYYEEKRRVFPPEAEREKGVTYDSNIFNLGNPIGVKI